MLEAEDQPPSEISVLITNTKEMRRLNCDFRGVDAATDVLSFPAGAGPEVSRRLLLGDVAICLPLAEGQARQHNTPIHTELACLAVHGGLHLLGYDDGTAAGRERMIAKMNAAVSAAGLDPSKAWASVDYQVGGRSEDRDSY